MQAEAEQPANDYKVCGFCNDSGSREKLIQPCACEGNFKFVHPSCLQQYRIFINDPVGFYRCLNCGVDYTTKQRKDHNLFFLICKFFIKGLLQFFSMFVYLFLIVFISGIPIYAIDTYCAHVLFSSADELNLHWTDDSMFLPRDLIWGLILDCLVLGVMTVIGGIVEATSDVEDDTLSYRDVERLGACCGVCLCCQPYIWRTSILRKAFLCGWCLCFPETFPAVTDCICCEIPCCSCGEKLFNMCCYVTDEHKYHKKGKFCDCDGNMCGSFCMFCGLLCGSIAFVMLGCGSKGGKNSLIIGLICLFVIACAMIIFGAFVGIIGIFVFVVMLTALNFKFIKRQALAEQTVLVDWDETVHPMPTHDAPDQQNILMEVVQVDQTYSTQGAFENVQMQQDGQCDLNYVPGGDPNMNAQNVPQECNQQYVPPPLPDDNIQEPEQNQKEDSPSDKDKEE